MNERFRDCRKFEERVAGRIGWAGCFRIPASLEIETSDVCSDNVVVDFRALFPVILKNFVPR